MSQAAEGEREPISRDRVVAAEPWRLAPLWWWSLLIVGLAMLVVSTTSHADSGTGNTGAQASLNFRITIPAIIRVTPVVQPDHLIIEDRHIADGYIDLDAGTSVNITINSRGGYVLSARYDSKVLSRVEVRVASQNLTTSSGYGSMRVSSGLLTDKLVPIGYRMHLAPGVRAGDYGWPVALAFSLATA